MLIVVAGVYIMKNTIVVVGEMAADEKN